MLILVVTSTETSRGMAFWHNIGYLASIITSTENLSKQKLMLLLKIRMEPGQLEF